jgi:hypothetical protein
VRALRSCDTFRARVAAGSGLCVACALVGGEARAGTPDIDAFRLAWENDLDAVTSVQSRAQPAPAYVSVPMSGYADETGTAGRFDWVPTLDLARGDFGIHASAALSIGELYELLRPGSTILFTPRFSAAPASLAATSPLVRHAEIEGLDAYLHDSLTLADDGRLTIRVGRHVLIWGESLFFPQNGVAAGQAPVDATRWRPDSGYQPDGVFLPVGQVSASWQAKQDFTLETYWQFEYRASRYGAVGDYRQPTALLSNQSAYRLGEGDGNYGAPAFAPDATAPPAPLDQAGVAIEWRMGRVDLGLYAERYTAKTPTIRLLPSRSEYQPGRYDLVYPSGIDMVGLAAAFRLGEADVAAEISARHAMPLTAAAIVVGDPAAAPPTGDTVHLDASWQWTTPPLPLVAAGAQWSGEVALNDVASRRDPAQILPGRTRFAAAFRTVFEPRFYQVVPRVDLSVPIGFGYGLAGSSETDSTMTRGVGDVDLGARLHFDQVWTLALDLTHYLGRKRALYLPFGPNSAGDPLTTGDFARLAVERRF